MYSKLVLQKITGVTDSQLKYWRNQGLLCPVYRGKEYYFSFKEIIKARLIMSLRGKGLSLQRIRKGINNLSYLLPNSDDTLSNLIIYTNGNDMIVADNGKHFSAITGQSFINFNTDEIKKEIIKLDTYNDVAPKKAANP